MSRYWLLALFAITLFLVLFFLVEAAGLALLTDPVPTLRGDPAAAILLGFTLLSIDSVLPIPSSIVMMGLGATLGFASGFVVSLAGSLCGALIGFAIGRAGMRALPDSDIERAKRFFEDYGPLAIAASRPVPLLAETVAVVAGASGMGWRKAVLWASLGSLPATTLYAWAGATASSGAGAWPFIAAILTAAILFVIGRRAKREDGHSTGPTVD